MGGIALQSCPRRAQLRPFYHLGRSLTPRTQAVEGHPQPMGAAPPFLDPTLMVGQVGPEWGWVLGRLWSSGAKAL